jgi:hypothetical protein
MGESEYRERCFVAYSTKVPSLSDTRRLGLALAQISLFCTIQDVSMFMVGI